MKEGMKEAAWLVSAETGQEASFIPHT